MSDAARTAEARRRTRRRRAVSTFEHRLRIGSGLVLAAFATMHFANHALGLASPAAMERGSWLTSVWQHPVTLALLYGGFAVHFALALRALYRRDTLRMPAWEAVQLGFGLAVPLLLAAHVAATRGAAIVAGFDANYGFILNSLWSDSWRRVKQPLALLVVWVHLSVGIHYWLRMRPGYARWRAPLFAFAVLLPTLAVLGYASGATEIAERVREPFEHAHVLSAWNALTPDARARVGALVNRAPWAPAILIALTFLARAVRLTLRRRGEHYVIEHPRAGSIRAEIGSSVLEALRAARVPHASVCGGRARCTTCRVRIASSAVALPDPGGPERAALARIGAADDVRLACQLRPLGNLEIVPLLPVAVDPRASAARGGVSGHEQQVVSVFVDMRGSTRLGEQRLPYDVVMVLNEFFTEMAAALDDTRGHYAQFAGDGLLALYGLKTPIAAACRDALRGAVAMSERLERLNRRLAADLPEPLSIGIGIHAGPAIVGTMGPPSSPLLSAIGDNVNIAARLEELSKVYGCTLVVSEYAAARAGIDLGAFPAHRAEVRGRHGTIGVRAVDDPRTLAPLLAR